MTSRALSELSDARQSKNSIFLSASVSPVELSIPSIPFCKRGSKLSSPRDLSLGPHRKGKVHFAK